MISADSKLQILDLFGRFAQCSDYGEWDGIPSLFVPDVVTRFSDYPFSYQGIEAQIAHAKETDELTGGKNRHYYFNFHIAGDESEAVVNYCFLNTNAGAAPMAIQLVTSGRMRDTVVNTAEGWKISGRLVTFDQTFDMPG